MNSYNFEITNIVYAQNNQKFMDRQKCCIKGKVNYWNDEEQIEITRITRIKLTLKQKQENDIKKQNIEKKLSN